MDWGFGEGQSNIIFHFTLLHWSQLLCSVLAFSVVIALWLPLAIDIKVMEVAELLGGEDASCLLLLPVVGAASCSCLGQQMFIKSLPKWYLRKEYMYYLALEYLMKPKGCLLFQLTVTYDESERWDYATPKSCREDISQKDFPVLSVCWPELRLMEIRLMEIFPRSETWWPMLVWSQPEGRVDLHLIG